MAKTKPHKKGGIVPPKTWHRIEVIKTGDKYISREHNASRWYLHDTELTVEEVVTTIQGDRSEKIKDLLLVFAEQETEIERLNEIIENYRNESEKIMGAM